MLIDGNNMLEKMLRFNAMFYADCMALVEPSMVL